MPSEKSYIGGCEGAKPHASQSDERASSAKKAQFENSQKIFIRYFILDPW